LKELIKIKIKIKIRTRHLEFTLQDEMDISDPILLHVASSQRIRWVKWSTKEGNESCRADIAFQSLQDQDQDQDQERRVDIPYVGW